MKLISSIAGQVERWRSPLCSSMLLPDRWEASSAIFLSDQMGQVLQNSPQPLFCASGCAIDFKITDKRERAVRLDCLLSMQEPWNVVIQKIFDYLGKLR